MPITSGVIEYERRLNLGEYNHKHVVAKILWTVEPGEDDDVLAAFAIDKVVMRVKDVLNWKPAVPDALIVELDKTGTVEPGPIAVSLENKAAPNLAAQHPAAEITAGIPPVLKRRRRTKAEMDAARAAAEAGPRGEDLVGPTARAAAADDPDIKSNRHGEPGPLAETPSASSSTAEPGMPSFDPDPEPPAEVTDQALLDACQAKASSGKPVADIKELVAKFSPGGLVQTPQDARRRFLDDLAKL